MHSEIDKRGIEVFHKPFWKTYRGQPFMQRVVREGKFVGFYQGSVEHQKCSMCSKFRNHVNGGFNYFDKQYDTHKYEKVYKKVVRNR